MTAQERFDERWTLNSATGCHEWTADTDRDGYGRFYYGGKKHRAHRWIWEEKVGPIPEGHVVRHVKCANPSCVRVDHLEPGTQAENAADREADGNTARGERNGRAKLRAEQVREIRRRYAEEETSYRRLADEYGLEDSSTIRQVIRRKTWTHVE